MGIDNPYEFLTADEPTAKEQAAATVAALRRQKALGILGALTGDPVLSKVGAGMMEEAARGEEKLSGFAGTRLSKALELQKMRQEGALRKEALARQSREQAALEQHRQAQLGIQRGELGLRQADFGLKRRQFEAGEWRTQNDPATGGIIKYNSRTGETVALGPGGGAPGAKTAGSGVGPVGKLTESQANAAFFMQQGVNAFKQARAAQAKGGILPGTGVKGNVEALGWAARPYAPSMVPENMQTRQSLLLSLAEPIVRAESGAAVPPEEVRRLAIRYVPSPGEPRSEQLRKLDALAGSYRSLQRKVGPAEAANFEPALREIESWVEQIKFGEGAGSSAAPSGPVPLADPNSYYE
jgi:hypothetical protein